MKSLDKKKFGMKRMMDAFRSLALVPIESDIFYENISKDKLHVKVVFSFCNEKINSDVTSAVKLNMLKHVLREKCGLVANSGQFQDRVNSYPLNIYRGHTTFSGYSNRSQFGRATPNELMTSTYDDPFTHNEHIGGSAVLTNHDVRYKVLSVETIRDNTLVIDIEYSIHGVHSEILDIVDTLLAVNVNINIIGMLPYNNGINSWGSYITGKLVIKGYSAHLPKNTNVKIFDGEDTLFEFINLRHVLTVEDIINNNYTLLDNLPTTEFIKMQVHGIVIKTVTISPRLQMVIDMLILEGFTVTLYTQEEHVFNITDNGFIGKAL